MKSALEKYFNKSIKETFQLNTLLRYSIRYIEYGFEFFKFYLVMISIQYCK